MSDRQLTGAELIAAERRRQVTEEGFTAEHDRQHGATAALGFAARAYLLAWHGCLATRRLIDRVEAGDPRCRGPEAEETAELYRRDPLGVYFGRDEHGILPPTVGWDTWPWDRESWKPSADPVRNLVKAGALIAAEIDRLALTEGAEVLEAGS